jgi:hypothetical protein
VITLKPMNKIVIRCTFDTAEDFRGMHDLVADEFLVELQVDEDGKVSSWTVDDRTACFHTDLTKYDDGFIQFEGSENKGQTGSLKINRNQCTFVQKSDVNGEWLTLRGVCEELA